MTNTVSNDLTTSESTDNQSTSPSLYQVAEAINQNPAKWVHPHEQELIVHSIENVDAEEMKEAFEKKKLPDGTGFGALQGMLPNVSSQYTEAVGDYLNTPDKWDVITLNTKLYL